MTTRPLLIAIAACLVVTVTCGMYPRALKPATCQQAVACPMDDTRSTLRDGNIEQIRLLTLRAERIERRLAGDQ